MRNGRAHGGFTLVEALLAIVIIGVMMVAVAHILISGMESYSLVSDRREALQEARLAVNMMTGELQTIADPATDIASITPTSITFTSSGGESVTYAISGTTLLRNTKILAQGVTGASGFAYYTAGGATTTNRAQIHRVGVTVTVDTGVGAHGTVTIRSGAYLRNRYYSAFSQP